MTLDFLNEVSRMEDVTQAAIQDKESDILHEAEKALQELAALFYNRSVWFRPRRLILQELELPVKTSKFRYSARRPSIGLLWNKSPRLCSWLIWTMVLGKPTSVLRLKRHWVFLKANGWKIPCVGISRFIPTTR